MNWKWSYLINPLGAGIDLINEKVLGVPPEPSRQSSQSIDFGSKWNQFKNWLGQRWDDLTGKSQITYENELQRQLAEEEYQRNLQSIGDTASAYEAAGFNPNIMYGGSNGSPVSYSAPNLQSYSGSKKLDNILQRTGAILNMIPAMYQATAALESIDQARERTKQSEIKTMSMGMNLLDQSYKLGDTALAKPFVMSWSPSDFGGKRHANNYWQSGTIWKPWYSGDNNGYWRSKYEEYADAALQHQFDLLKSIGIKNQMNSTLNSWRGYQYDLDRRFGAAGRIVGMASQGARAAGSLFSPIKLSTNLYRSR